MKQNLIISLFAAALLGSGVANAAGTLYASQYGTPDYTGRTIKLGSAESYDKLVVDVPLTLTSLWGYLDLYDGATLAFSKKNGADSICGIFISAEQEDETVYFNESGDVYNITFDADAEAIVAASAGTPITLIEDLNKESEGFNFCFLNAEPSDTTLKLNGKGYNETVVLDGVSFTYVGPKESDYVFQTGEIGFTGYYGGSHALKLVVGNATPTPEPTTGTLSLLALAGLCIRRRK